MAATKKGRDDLADRTGISASMLLEWVNRADLERIKGVGPEYADLLEAAGVDSPAELAHRNAEHLTMHMHEVNEKKHLVRRVPSMHEVEGWISEAAKLPRMVTH